MGHLGGGQLVSLSPGFIKNVHLAHVCLFLRWSEPANMNFSQFVYLVLRIIAN